MSAGLVVADRYRLIHLLGSGGMGSVWLAQDLSLNTEVAIKLIDSDHADSPESLARFQREAQAAAAIRSTHVVQILDYGVDGIRPYIAMELLRGESLAARLDRLSKLSPEDTAHILGHVGRALAIAHKQGIIHRDLKPDNIFVVREDEDEIGKVLDFGIARNTDGRAMGEAIKTQTGALLGTPYYMSPEQASGKPVDYLTDIWSYGVIAFECLTGQRAFGGESLASLFHAVCMAELPIPSEVAPVPVGFDAWFKCVTARNKIDRYQSIKQAAEDLRTICSGGGLPTELTYARGPVTVKTGNDAPSKISAALGVTPAPSSLTMPGIPKARLGLPLTLALVFSVILAIGSYWGWQRLRGAPVVAVASDSAPVQSAIAAAPATALTLPSVSVAQTVDAGTSFVATGSAVAPSAKPLHTAIQRNLVTPRTVGAPSSGSSNASNTRPRRLPANDDDNVAAF